jgi:hypothetical protein
MSFPTPPQSEAVREDPGRVRGRTMPEAISTSAFKADCFAALAMTPAEYISNLEKPCHGNLPAIVPFGLKRIPRFYSSKTFVSIRFLSKNESPPSLYDTLCQV